MNRRNSKLNFKKSIIRLSRFVGRQKESESNEERERERDVERQ